MVSDAEKSKNNPSNDVARLCGQVLVASTGEAELLSNVLAGSSQIARATAKLRHARNIISTQCKELAKIAQLEVSVKNVEDNVGPYKAS